MQHRYAESWNLSGIHVQLVTSLPYTATKKTPQQHSLYSLHTPDALRCNAEHVCCDTAQQSATTHTSERQGDVSWTHAFRQVSCDFTQFMHY